MSPGRQHWDHRKPVKVEFHRDLQLMQILAYPVVDAMIERNLTYYDVAGQLGWSVAQVEKMLTGGSHGSWRSWEKLLAHFDLEISVLPAATHGAGHARTQEQHDADDRQPEQAVDDHAEHDQDQPDEGEKDQESNHA